MDQTRRVTARRASWIVVALVTLAVAFSWILTWLSAGNFNDLIFRQISGAAPTDILLYLVLSGVMMFAMMIPSAFPMIETYGGMATLDAGKIEGEARTIAFAAGYMVLWTLFTALSLVVLMVLGLIGSMGGPATYAPAIVLLTAGAYQFSSWKMLCLRYCRTPLSFLMTRWRPGRGGALVMGFKHGAFCLGCCWLLMLVLFVAGAMSVLWMGVFSALILAEKVWSRGETLSRFVGVAAIAVGLASVASAYFFGGAGA